MLKDDDMKVVVGGSNKVNKKVVSSALSALMMVPVTSMPVNAVQGANTEKSFVSKLKGGFNKGFSRVSGFLDRNPWVKPVLSAMILVTVGTIAFKEYRNYRDNQERKRLEERERLFADELARERQKNISVVEEAEESEERKYTGEVYVAKVNTVKEGEVLEAAKEKIEHDEEIKRLKEELSGTNSGMEYELKEASEFCRAKRELLEAQICKRMRELEAKVADDLCSNDSEDDEYTKNSKADAKIRTSIRLARANKQVEEARIKSETCQKKFESAMLLADCGRFISQKLHEIQEKNEASKKEISEYESKVSGLETELEQMSLKIKSLTEEVEKAKVEMDKANENFVAAGERSSNSGIDSNSGETPDKSEQVLAQKELDHAKAKHTLAVNRLEIAKSEFKIGKVSLRSDKAELEKKRQLLKKGCLEEQKERLSQMELVADIKVKEMKGVRFEARFPSPDGYALFGYRMYLGMLDFVKILKEQEISRSCETFDKLSAVCEEIQESSYALKSIIEDAEEKEWKKERVVERQRREIEKMKGQLKIDELAVDMTKSELEKSELELKKTKESEMTSISGQNMGLD